MSTVETMDAVRACPQCNSTEAWGENSWCPQCGYYPKFAGLQNPAPPATDAQAAPESDTAVLDRPTLPEIGRANTPQPTTQHSEEAEEESAQGVPQWAKVLVAGVVTIMVASIGLRVWIHINGGRRALFAIGEMLVGFGCVFGSTIVAFIQCRKADKELSAFAIIMHPIDLWRPTFEQMPETRKRVWTLAWGLTMIIAANILVGGIKYSGVYTNDWGFEQPKTNKLVGNPAAMGGLGSEKDVDLEEVVEEYKQALAAGQPVEPPTVEGVVYGVLADGNLEMGRILIARRKGKLKHCATISGSELDDDDYDRLLTMVSENITTEAPVSSFFNATWVKPIIRVKLSFEDAVGGELVDPRFHSLESVSYSKKDDDDDSDLDPDESEPTDADESTDEPDTQQDSTTIPDASDAA